MTIEIDRESFHETATRIWRTNTAACRAHNTAADLADWMESETLKLPDGAYSWFGFVVVVSRSGIAIAALEAWYLDYPSLKTAHREQS